MTLRWIKKTLKITVLPKTWENWENLLPNTPEMMLEWLTQFFIIVAGNSSFKGSMFGHEQVVIFPG